MYNIGKWAIKSVHEKVKIARWYLSAVPPNEATVDSAVQLNDISVRRKAENRKTALVASSRG